MTDVIHLNKRCKAMHSRGTFSLIESRCLENVILNISVCRNVWKAYLVRFKICYLCGIKITGGNIVYMYFLFSVKSEDFFFLHCYVSDSY